MPEMTHADRLALCRVPVTLDGVPASIGGASLDYAIVRDRDGRAFEWAWPTARAIVEKKGGAFES